MKKVLDKIYKQLYNETDYNKEYSNIYKIHKYWSRKPWYLVEEYVKKHSKKGDVVLDPFMGSGCTGVESIINQRNFIGYDLNPISIKIANGTAIVVDDIKKLEDDFNNIKQMCYEEINNTYKTDYECSVCHNNLSIKHIKLK